jgi:hypothetical protein
MNNLVHGEVKKAVRLALAIPAGASAVDGSVQVLGEGLKVLMMTDRATTTTINAGTAAPGLADGQATCVLLDVDFVVNLAIAGGTAAAFEKIYRVTADGTYSSTAAGAVFIGYNLDIVTTGNISRVALAAV